MPRLGADSARVDGSRLARMPSGLLRLRRRCWNRNCGRWCRRTRSCLSAEASHKVRGGCGACLADCWRESFGCGGLTLASELGQSQLPDVLQKPASKGNSSTIATPHKQCQTKISRMLRECFSRRGLWVAQCFRRCDKLISWLKALASEVLKRVF